jgi:hypothetical protein
MEMETSDRHSTNAQYEISDSSIPHSNVTSDIARQLLKEAGQMARTDEGTQIDGSDSQARNAKSPISESFAPDSNVNIESARQP